MKRVIYIVLLLAIGFATGWIVRSVKRPAYPGEWDGLRLGMSESEAQLTVPRLDVSLREMKGFDRDRIDYGDRYWSLLVFYGTDGRVSEITKRYVDRRIGIFNRVVVEPEP